MINQTALDVVVAGLHNWKDFKINNPDFRFAKNLTRSLTEARDAIKGQLEYTFGKGNQEEVDETCGKNRTIIVTITNLNQPAKNAAARVLADTTVTNIGIKVESTSQPDSGFFGYSLSFLCLLALSALYMF